MKMLDWRRLRQPHVKDLRRRAAGMRAKNTPSSIPCAYVALDRSQGSVALAVDPVCLADGLFGKGFAP
jgi:hypothetical protein